MIKSTRSGSSHGLHPLRDSARTFGLRGLSRAALLGLAGSLACLHGAPALAQAGVSQSQTPGSASTPPTDRPSTPGTKAITANGKVVEDIVARVNDQIITRTEYDRSLQQLRAQGQQEGWTPTQLEDREHNLLRDMIDQQLLLSKGKELGITGDAETIRQLDDMRKRANLDSMEALQKAAEQQGVSFEDFKQNIRNQVVSQQVVQQEVGRRVDMSHSREQAYYQAHLKDFEQVEQVHLSEILIPTPENATEAQLSEAQSKADAASAKLKAGASFADLAKQVSGGPTASAGGDLGDFKRGVLGDVLEKATFPLPVGATTAPIRTRQGFVILKVDSHQQPGTPPLEQIEAQVQQALYLEELQPALRAYLTKARDDAYMSPLPAGFVDSGAPKENTSEVYTAYAPPKIKKKVLKKQESEQAAARKAEQQLAEARAKLAAKQATEKAQKAGLRNVSTEKPKKIRREKVRYGQAPRNALPTGTATETVDVPSLGATPGTAATPGASTTPDLGIAPGAAATTQQASTVITAGTGEANDDPLAPQAPAPEQKTRFSARQNQNAEKKADVKLSEVSLKSSKRAAPATAQEAADESFQGQALGLKGDQLKKQPKKKRKKGEPVQRLQKEPVHPVETPIEDTVNPSLGAGIQNPKPQSTPDKPSSDHSTLPPPSTDNAAPNAGPEGQPIPSVTGTTPDAPASTVPQPH